jgi:hypothetical protein
MILVGACRSRSTSAETSSTRGRSATAASSAPSRGSPSPRSSSSPPPQATAFPDSSWPSSSRCSCSSYVRGQPCGCSTAGVAAGAAPAFAPARLSDRQPRRQERAGLAIGVRRRARRRLSGRQVLAARLGRAGSTGGGAGQPSDGGRHGCLGQLLQDDQRQGEDAQRPERNAGIDSSALIETSAAAKMPTQGCTRSERRRLSPR